MAIFHCYVSSPEGRGYHVLFFSHQTDHQFETYPYVDTSTYVIGSFGTIKARGLLLQWHPKAAADRKMLILMDFNGDLMDFNGDLMDFNGDLMDFNGDLMDFNGDLMVI